MKKGVVAIVGRANVGKSTIFNRIVGKRVSIVEDTPGVTRDRIYGDASWLTREFRIIDTGGIELENASFTEQIKMQAEIAIEEADIILFVVNGREGITKEGPAWAMWTTAASTSWRTGNCACVVTR